MLRSSLEQSMHSRLLSGLCVMATSVCTTRPAIKNKKYRNALQYDGIRKYFNVYFISHFVCSSASFLLHCPTVAYYNQ